MIDFNYLLFWFLVWLPLTLGYFRPLFWTFVVASAISYSDLQKVWKKKKNLLGTWLFLVRANILIISKDDYSTDLISQVMGVNQTGRMSFCRISFHQSLFNSFSTKALVVEKRALLIDKNRPKKLASSNYPTRMHAYRQLCAQLEHNLFRNRVQP